MATDIIETKVFKNGNSQAVRIPKAFNLEAERVYIHQKKMVIWLSPPKAHPTNGMTFWHFLLTTRKSCTSLPLSEICAPQKSGSCFNEIPT